MRSYFELRHASKLINLVLGAPDWLVVLAAVSDAGSGLQHVLSGAVLR